MTKIVPGPPVLCVRSDLTADKAMEHACEHMANALRVALLTTEAEKSGITALAASAKHQIDVASMLLDIVIAEPQEARKPH